MISPQKSKLSGKQIKSNNILRSLFNIHRKKKKKKTFNLFPECLVVKFK